MDLSERRISVLSLISDVSEEYKKDEEDEKLGA